MNEENDKVNPDVVEIHSTEEPIQKTVKERVEHAFEAFRDRLVNLLGDIPGVHNVVDDAKVAITPHIGD